MGAGTADSCMMFQFGRDPLPFGQAEQLFVFQMRLSDAKVSLHACKSRHNLRFTLERCSTRGTGGKVIVDLQQSIWGQMPFKEGSKFGIGDVFHLLSLGMSPTFAENYLMLKFHCRNCR